MPHDEGAAGMSRDEYAIHLVGAGYSGRAVKFRELTIPELDDVSLRANKGLDRDSTQQEYLLAVRRCGIRAFLVAVTAPLPAGADILAGDVKWEPLNEERLTMDERWKYENIFRVKDDAIIAREYSKLHDPSFAEASELVGKLTSSSSSKSTNSRPESPSAGTGSPSSAATATSA